MNEGSEDHTLLIFHRRNEDPNLVVYLLKVDEKGQWLIKAMLFGETISLCCFLVLQKESFFQKIITKLICHERVPASAH